MENYNCKNIYYNLQPSKRLIFRKFIEFLKEKKCLDDFFSNIDFYFANFELNKQGNTNNKITDEISYFQYTPSCKYVWNAWNWGSDFWHSINRQWRKKQSNENY